MLMLVFVFFVVCFAFLNLALGIQRKILLATVQQQVNGLKREVEVHQRQMKEAQRQLKEEHRRLEEAQRLAEVLQSQLKETTEQIQLFEAGRKELKANLEAKKAFDIMNAKALELLAFSKDRSCRPSKSCS